MTSTTRALLSAVVVAGVVGVAAGAFVGEVGGAASSPPRDREPTPAPITSSWSISPMPRAEARFETPPLRPTSYAAAPGTSASTTTAGSPPRHVVVDGLVVDTAGTPVASATVECVWENLRNSEPRVLTTSNVDGTFRVNVIPAAALSVHADGFVSGWGEVQLDDPGDRLLTIVLASAATVRGVVTYQHRPVFGARVRLTTPGKCTRYFHRIKTTDQHGRFEFTGQSEDRYGLSAVVEINEVPRLCSTTRTIAVGEGTTVEASLTLLEIHEVVVNVRAADGETVTPHWLPRIVASGERLIVEDDPIRSWAPVHMPFEVLVHHEGRTGRSDAAPGAQIVDVTLTAKPAEAARTDVVARPRVDAERPPTPPARVRGRVVDRRGHAVRVGLTLGDARARADRLGRFSFDLVPLGRHTLSTTSPLDLVAARFHAKRATLRERIIDVTRPEELDLGDLVVEVE